MDQKQENFRPPIVTIMGHVDHGKTTLLDVIRKTNVAAGEHGGITQHIGAYQITFQDKKITFIDTPGHAAFEKMRSRGAEVADIIILVVAANDGVKPQTKEAIKHIKIAGKPLIVALTKTDLPDINLDRVKKELEKEEIIVESYGGDVPIVEVAATKGKGISDLLEIISLVWQLNPQKSQPTEPLEAVVIESFMDKSRGPVSSVIINKGTLNVGQKILIDGETISVRSLIDDAGKQVKQAEPSKPVEILGFKNTLEVGSIVTDINQQAVISPIAPVTLSEILRRSEEARDRFKIILKADVVGSLEAILLNLPEKILPIMSGIGEVNNADISFAKAAGAPIIAFNVKIAPNAKSQSEKEGVIIRPYNVIYQLIEDMADVAQSFTAAKQELKITGRAKVIAEFNIEGQRVAGVMVTSGKLRLGDQLIIRNNDQDPGRDVEITSLKKFKKDVDFVSNGQDCGIVFKPNIDFAIGSIIESFGKN